MKETKQTGTKKSDTKVAAGPNIFVFAVVIVIIIAFLFVGDVPKGIEQLITDMNKEQIVNDDGTLSIYSEAQVSQNSSNPNAYVGKVLNEKIQIGRDDEFNYKLQYILGFQQANVFQKYQQAMIYFNDEVNKIIGMHNAKKMNIYLSESRLIKAIGNRYKDSDGDINYREMKKNVEQVNQLRKQMEQSMLYEHYTTDMFTGLPVSKEEVLDAYYEENRKLKIQYVTVRSDNIDEAELEAYFNSNSENYKKYRVTSLVFKEEKDAEKALKEISADESKFTDIGNKLKEEGKVVNFQYGTTFSFLDNLENDELKELVKATASGKIGAKVVTLKTGPSIIKVDEVKESLYSDAEVAAKAKSDYLAANTEAVEAKNLEIARELYNKMKEVKDNTSDIKELADGYGASYATADYITFMSYSFPNLNTDVTDDLNFMVKAFKAEKGTVLEPYQTDNGTMVVLVDGLSDVSEEKFEELYDRLSKRHSDKKSEDIKTDFYKEERKKHKIVDNSRYVFGEMILSQQNMQ